MFRYAGQDEGKDSVTWGTNNDDGQPDDFTIRCVQRCRAAQLGIGQHGPQPDHVAGEPCRLPCRCVEPGHGRTLHAGLPQHRHPRRLAWISRRSRQAPAATPERSPTARYFKSRTMCRCCDGNHAFKFGANFNLLYHLGILNGNEHFATFEFFDDPSVIFHNTNGLYPQGSGRQASSPAGSRRTAAP